MIKEVLAEGAIIIGGYKPVEKFFEHGGACGARAQDENRPDGEEED